MALPRLRICAPTRSQVHDKRSGEGRFGGTLWNASCGAVAATLAHVVTYPNDTVRRRLQLQGCNGAPIQYQGAVDCLVKVSRQEGWRALYAGLGVTMLRGVPNTGIQFCVYEACKDFTVAEERRRRL